MNDKFCFYLFLVGRALLRRSHGAFCHVGSRDQTQAIRLGGCLYAPSLLKNTLFCFVLLSWSLICRPGWLRTPEIRLPLPLKVAGLKACVTTALFYFLRQPLPRLCGCWDSLGVLVLVKLAQPRLSPPPCHRTSISLLVDVLQLFGFIWSL